MSSFTTPLEYQKIEGSHWGNPLYRTTAAFSYKFGSEDAPLAVFTVPDGFETDLATIPWPISKVFHPDGPWVKAAVLHDYLCGQDHISRVVQDSIFYEAMRVLGINRLVALAFFVAVRTFRAIRYI